MYCIFSYVHNNSAVYQALKRGSVLGQAGMPAGAERVRHSKSIKEIRWALPAPRHQPVCEQENVVLEACLRCPVRIPDMDKMGRGMASLGGQKLARITKDSSGDHGCAPLPSPPLTYLLHTYVYESVNVHR